MTLRLAGLDYVPSVPLKSAVRSSEGVCARVAHDTYSLPECVLRRTEDGADEAKRLREIVGLSSAIMRVQVAASSALKAPRTSDRP